MKGKAAKQHPLSLGLDSIATICYGTRSGKGRDEVMHAEADSKGKKLIPQDKHIERDRCRLCNASYARLLKEYAMTRKRILAIFRAGGHPYKHDGTIDIYAGRLRSEDIGQMVGFPPNSTPAENSPKPSPGQQTSFL